MTIYRLMNRIFTLRFNLLLAVEQYKKDNPQYWIWEEEAKASLDTLSDCGYLDDYDISELEEQLYHIMRMYKRRCKRG